MNIKNHERRVETSAISDHYHTENLQNIKIWYDLITDLIIANISHLLY